MNRRFDCEGPVELRRPTHETGSLTIGYKRTEGGVIPEDWYTATIRDLFDYQRTASNSREDLDGSGSIAYVHYGDLHTRFKHFIDFACEDIPCLSASLKVSATQLRDGDLIVADASEDEEGVGTSAEVRNLGSIRAVSGLHTILLRPRDLRVASGYRAYILENVLVRKQIRRVATGLKVFGITKYALGNILVPLPELPEQRAIADALSDVDSLLSSLEALIAKKRAIKQAAMQQFLTGQTRLPGFGGEWETKRMGKMGSIYGGLSGKSKRDFDSGNARYVTFLSILGNVLLNSTHTSQVRVSPGESQNCVLKEDLLFNGTSETPDDLAIAAVMDEQVDGMYLNSFCFGFRIHDKEKQDPLFLAYFFRGTPGRANLKSLAQGATRYNLSKNQFLAIEISIPNCNEQRAIAAVLSDMDSEIAALDLRYDKTRAIKQGMMQQLLTGRVRLVEPEAVESVA